MEKAIQDLMKANRKIKKQHNYPCGLEPRETADMIKDGKASFFFNSPDRQNGELYYALRELKWRNAKYEACYYWAVWKDDWMIEYVEGDVYIIKHPKNCIHYQTSKKQSRTRI